MCQQVGTDGQRKRNKEGGGQTQPKLSAVKQENRPHQRRETRISQQGDVPRVKLVGLPHHDGQTQRREGEGQQVQHAKKQLAEAVRIGNFQNIFSKAFPSRTEAVVHAGGKAARLGDGVFVPQAPAFDQAAQRQIVGYFAADGRVAAQLVISAALKQHKLPVGGHALMVGAVMWVNDSGHRQK